MEVSAVNGGDKGTVQNGKHAGIGMVFQATVQYSSRGTALRQGNQLPPETDTRGLMEGLTAACTNGCSFPLTLGRKLVRMEGVDRLPWGASQLPTLAPSDS